MKIEDLIIILNNRLREFRLSKDYARMSGDLKKMNAADKEINALEDTLYQLSLLVDASKSAVTKESSLTEEIIDGSVSVLDEYDISSYATDPSHEQKIMEILSKMGIMDEMGKIEKYIRDKYESSPVTGEMVMNAVSAYSVDARLMMAIMEQDSRFGTVGVAVRTLNPGNVGNDDDDNTRTYDSWQAGVTAVAEWLNRHRVAINGETPTIIIDSSVATTTSPVATTTELVATTTPSVATTTEAIATTTPSVATTTSPVATTTEPVATTTPSVATETSSTTTEPTATTTEEIF